MLNVIWPAYLLVNKHDQAEHTAHQYCSPQLYCRLTTFVLEPSAVSTVCYRSENPIIAFE